MTKLQCDDQLLKGGNNEDFGIIIKIDMTAIKDKGIEVNLRDALLEAKESIEGKRKLNYLVNNTEAYNMVIVNA